jgi:hypothetical protein
MIKNMNSQDIENRIGDNLPIRILEKDHFGEVMSPAILINELLDNLPAHVWTNSENTWLDPAAGSGNFFMAVYVRLLHGLAKKIPSLADRKKHILTKMLFMVEINPYNTKILRKLFGPDANIDTDDFLHSDILDKKYNIIIGNPPYQSNKTEKYVGSVGGQTLWDKFVVKSLKTLENLGHLAFITPANWRRPDSKLYDLMTRQNRLHYLHIYNKAAGARLFHVETRFDVYIIQNNGLNHGLNLGKDKQAKNPTIIDEKGEKHQDIDIQMWPFLPNYAYSAISKILVKEQGIPIIFDSSLYDARKLTKHKTAKYHYPIVHTITQKGLGVRFADTKSNDQFIPKILLNFNERQYPHNDYLGKYGMSQLTFGIPIDSKSQGDKIITAINSPAFSEIIAATKWSAFQTDYRMFKYFSPDFYLDKMFAVKSYTLKKNGQKNGQKNEQKNRQSRKNRS